MDTITFKLGVMVGVAALALAAGAEGGGGSCLFYGKWTVSAPVLTAGPQGTFDDVAVKDPSVVYYGGRYHVFYTSKAARETAVTAEWLGADRSGLGYVSAPTLEGLRDARRCNLGALVKCVLIAPQVFYFEPQKRWYLIAHTQAPGKRPDLTPVYLTNPDVADVRGWSAPKELKARKTDNGFWIDFWA